MATKSKPADEQETAAATTNDGLELTGELITLTALPAQGTIVIYEGFNTNDEGQSYRASYPAIIESVLTTDDPESPATLSYLRRAEWHYVTNADFGTEAGCWHWPELPTIEAK